MKLTHLIRVNNLYKMFSDGLLNASIHVVQLCYLILFFCHDVSSETASLFVFMFWGIFLCVGVFQGWKYFVSLLQRAAFIICFCSDAK